MVMFDLAVVGHLCIDYISINGSKPRRALGGPPTYTSLAAKALGLKTAIISKVGEDFPKEYLSFLAEKGVNLSWLKIIKGAESTKFLLEYYCGERKLKLLGLAPKIMEEDVPRNVKFSASHVSPVAGEIGFRAIRKLRSQSRIMTLDAQGFVRSFNNHGYVNLVPWCDFRILGLVDVFKASLEEIRLIAASKSLEDTIKHIHGLGVKVVIVTMGSNGSLISNTDNGAYFIPTYKQVNVVDSTGAGDAYMAGFLQAYIRGENIAWCGCMGASTSSFILENFGPSKFGSLKEVYNRAEKLYALVEKVF